MAATKGKQAHSRALAVGVALGAILSSAAGGQEHHPMPAFAQVVIKVTSSREAIPVTHFQIEAFEEHRERAVSYGAKFGDSTGVMRIWFAEPGRWVARLRCPGYADTSVELVVRDALLDTTRFTMRPLAKQSPKRGRERRGS